MRGNGLERGKTFTKKNENKCQLGLAFLTSYVYMCAFIFIDEILNLFIKVFAESGLSNLLSLFSARFLDIVFLEEGIRR